MLRDKMGRGLACRLVWEGTMYLGLELGWEVSSWVNAMSKTEALTALGVPRLDTPTHFAHFFPFLCMHPDGLVMIWG